MTINVGISRGLTYYYIYPFMEGFLKGLGIQPVLSPPTDARILSSINCCPTDEPCVSVKLFYAHVQALLKKGVDYLFIPVLSSIEKPSYCCPKFIGAAAMVQNGLDIPAEKILAPEINERDKPGCWKKNLLSVAGRLGASKSVAKRAIKLGLKRQREFYNLTREGLTTPEAYRKMAGLPPARRRTFDPSAQYDDQQVIGVMGHPYVMYDIVGHNIVERLREYGRVITPEMVPLKDSQKELATIYEGEKMWTYEGRLLGAAFHLLRQRIVDKMVLIEAFECGPASIIEAYLEEEAERQGIPFLLLTVDEHTGEAGLVTRIEAFIDTAPVQSFKQKKGAVLNVITGDRQSRLKIGSPSMGWADKALASVLEECNVEVVPTPKVTRKTVELGKELAPEFICYPMVTTLGQMRQIIEAGANMIVMVGGKGRCRLGWYAQIQELLLKRKGYDFRLVIIDSPVPLIKNWRKFKKAVKLVTNNSSWAKIIRGLYLGYLKMKVLDEAEKQVRRKRAYETEKGSADKLWKRLTRRLLAVNSSKDIKKMEQEFSSELNAIPEEDTNPLRVRIIGEIYTVIENYVNQNIEEFLASRPDLRVYVERELTPSSWFDLHVLRKHEAVERYQKIIAAALPYLPVSVGGHGRESIGEAVLAKQEGIDGVIHLFPFTCMPEIVAQNILVPLCQILDLPFLSLVLSEQTGSAGLQTRLEAFLEVLLERREKEMKVYHGGEILGLLPGY